MGLEPTNLHLMQMTNKLSLLLTAVGVMAVVVVLSFFGLKHIEAATTFNVSVLPNHSYKNFTFFNATTTTATSTNVSDGGSYLVINGARKVTMYFTHGGTATTSTTGARFTVQTTKDGVIWDNFSKLIGPDLSSTATSSYAIQGATSTAPVGLDLSDDTFYAIRCIATEYAGALATDGEHTCSASVEF